MKWYTITLPSSFAGNASATDGVLRTALTKKNLGDIEASAIPPKIAADVRGLKQSGSARVGDFVEPCDDSSPGADEITARRFEEHHRLEQTRRPR